MKITKYLHSCLLVENENKTILIDPGMFSTPVLDINKITQLDYLLITHEHPDHMHLPLIHELVKKFPEVKIITNPSIVEILKNENIQATSEEDAIVSFETANHERLWDKKPPENISISIFNKLTHVGDSLHFTKTFDVLALPLTAPWCNTTEAINKSLAMKPKFIIPIHDFMWKEEFRKGMYGRLTEFFKEKGIDFKGVETGETVTVEN